MSPEASGARLHVWIVEVSDFLPGLDEGQRLLRAGMLATALTAAGHDVHWWSSTFNHQRKRQRFDASTTCALAEGLTARLLYGPGYTRNRSLARLRHNRALARAFVTEASAAIRERRPDVIIAHFPTLEVTAQAVEVARAHGIPVIVDVRDQHPDFIVASLPRQLRPLARVALAGTYARTRRIFGHATGITGVSNSNVAWALARAGRTARPTDGWFPLGYRESAHSDARDAAVVEHLDIRRDEMVITYAGSFARSYDLHTVLEAAARLQRRGMTDLRFVLVGDGDQMTELRARAAALPNVSFAGWCDGSTLAAILARSDVGLAPYARGVPITLPNKPIEYMAAGLPLLTSLEGELCELVSHERIGVQYTADDVEGLVSAIELLRREPEMRRAMGERSRRVYEERFTADAVYDRFAAHVCAVARHMLND